MTAVREAAMRAIVERQQPLGAFLGCIETQLRQLVQAKSRGPIAVAHAPRAVITNRVNRDDRPSRFKPVCREA